MPNDISPMHDYFSRLGLEPEIADIYLALHAYGPQSLLQLSRNADVERTRLYRLLDTLSSNHLIEVEERYKRKLYKAAPISNLQIILTSREQQLRELQKEFQNLKDTFPTSPTHSPLTHVQFYQGIDGLKQMFWNQTRAKGESVSILHENLQTRTNLTFFERWIERCNSQDLKFRSLVGDNFLQAQQKWYTNHSNEKLKYWKGRYILNDIYPITHSTVTYDDVVSYYNWHQGKMFGIEVYNQQIADAQRRIFDLLWEQGIAIPGHGEKPLEVKS